MVTPQQSGTVAHLMDHFRMSERRARKAIDFAG